jgi:D-glycero-alpha-D-manno-heptose-7-phosphate kinase
MIISKTPFRVSFFGGGTDFPEWFEENEGLIISSTIDKYCYIACRYLPPFFDVNYRIAYSEIELTKNISEIKHPVVGATLAKLGFQNNSAEIIHYADLPSRTGIGSSSSFTVGLLNALYSLKGEVVSKYDLGIKAIEIEKYILQENVGLQDQIAVANGGFNLIKFTKNKIELNPIYLPNEKLSSFESSLILIYTGISRNSSELTHNHINNISKKSIELTEMVNLTKEAYKSLKSDGASIEEIGRMLDEGWRIKKSFSKSVTTSYIDDIYMKAKSLGAIGGKVIGAGGGGFVLLFANPERHQEILSGLTKYLHVPFKFESLGTHINTL